MPKKAAAREIAIFRGALELLLGYFEIGTLHFCFASAGGFESAAYKVSSVYFGD
ncbi:hypothetical protein NTGBS_800007 [Candidatus Nitrotoga sp. BS]|nr:hypothetical protein NTGBS_800007 [Candidatus Nitrotoga sp. BS]